MFSDPLKEIIDPWLEVIGGIDQFNRVRKDLFSRVPVVVLDKSMCA